MNQGNQAILQSQLKSFILFRIAGFFKYLFLLVIVFISLLPLIWVFLSSFKTNMDILNSPLSIPQKWDLDGYVEALTISPLYNFYGNSIVISLTSMVLNVFILSMAAYVLARFKFKWKNPVMVILSVSLFIPITALIQPIYMVVKTIGLYNTKTGLILVYTALGLPVSLFILRSYFLSISNQMEEAAYIDGAGFFKTFVKIVIPAAKPGFATAAVLQFLLSWNEFLFALILTSSKENRTLPMALGYFTSQFSFNYTALFAAVVMVIIPSIIIFVILQEQVVNGLTAGAVKG